MRFVYISAKMETCKLEAIANQVSIICSAPQIIKDCGGQELMTVESYSNSRNS